MHILLSGGLWLTGWAALLAIGCLEGSHLRRTGSDETEDFVSLTSKISNQYFKEALLYTVLCAISYFIGARFPAISWITFAIAAINVVIQMILSVCSLVAAFRGKLKCAVALAAFIVLEVVLEVALAWNLLNLAR